MKVTIYHQLEFPRLIPLGQSVPIGPLEKVATILMKNTPVALALTEALALTNSSSTELAEHVEMYPSNDPMGHRSTSIGDVVVVNCQDAYQCERNGWAKIDVKTVRGFYQPC